MKVDIKIVPIEVEEKSGWFSKKKKKMHQLQYRIELTDVEKAIIEKAGIGEFITLEKEHRISDEYSETMQYRIQSWLNFRTDYGRLDYDTLIEAQAAGQQLKANLVRLKEMMDIHQNVGTEDSFEL